MGAHLIPLVRDIWQWAAQHDRTRPWYGGGSADGKVQVPQQQIRRKRRSVVCGFDDCAGAGQILPSQTPYNSHGPHTTPGETTYLLPRLVRGRSQSLPKERGEKQNLFNDRSCSKHGEQRYSLPKLLKAARLLKSQINTFLELSLRPSGWTLAHNYKGN